MTVADMRTAPTAGVRRTPQEYPTPAANGRAMWIRTHEHNMASLHDKCGFIGQEFGQFLWRALGARDRAHLDPVAEKHDRHEGGQLPPEKRSIKTKFDSIMSSFVLNRDLFRNTGLEVNHHSNLANFSFDNALKSSRIRVDVSRQVQ